MTLCDTREDTQLRPQAVIGLALQFALCCTARARSRKNVSGLDTQQLPSTGTVKLQEDVDDSVDSFTGG